MSGDVTTAWAVIAKYRNSNPYDSPGFCVRFAEANHARGFAATLSFALDKYDIEIVTTTTEKVGMRDDD